MHINDKRITKYPLLLAAWRENVDELFNSSNSLAAAFDWSDSLQGSGFWSAISSGDIDKAKKILPSLFFINEEDEIDLSL